MSEGASVDYSNNGGWGPHLVMLGDCSIVVEHLPLQKAQTTRSSAKGGVRSAASPGRQTGHEQSVFPIGSLFISLRSATQLALAADAYS